MKKEQQQYTRGRMRFRKAWVFPKEVTEWLRNQLKTCKHPILHVPCGSSRLGDVLVDQHYEPPLKNYEVTKADFFNLPYPDASFPTIISDPPWEMPYDKRAALVKELARVLKPGGVLLFNAFWVPDTAKLELNEVWIRWPRGGFPSNPSLLIRSIKKVD